MPKIVDHDSYRQELLEKSLAIFVKKGFQAVSIRELSRELGVSTGTLYHYFPSKEALFQAMVKQFVQQDAQEIANLSEEKVHFSNLVEYVSRKESHFLDLIHLAMDVKRHCADSIELNELLHESWDSYRMALNRFFAKKGQQQAGQAMFSFLLGGLFLRTFVGSDIDWSELRDGLSHLTIFLKENKYEV